MNLVLALLLQIFGPWTAYDPGPFDIDRHALAMPWTSVTRFPSPYRPVDAVFTISSRPEIWPIVWPHYGSNTRSYSIYLQLSLDGPYIPMPFQPAARAVPLNYVEYLNHASLGIPDYGSPLKADCADAFLSAKDAFDSWRYTWHDYGSRSGKSLDEVAAEDEIHFAQKKRIIRSFVRAWYACPELRPEQYK